MAEQRNSFLLVTANEINHGYTSGMLCKLQVISLILCTLYINWTYFAVLQSWNWMDHTITHVAKENKTFSLTGDLNQYS